MTAEQLAEARALAASPRLSGGTEYQRAALAVLLDIRDRLEASAPPVVVASTPAPVVAPSPVAAPAPAPKRGR